MENEEIIKDVLSRNGFKKMNCRDTWLKSNWTVRFYDNDVEIYDEDKYYLMGNVDSLNMDYVIEDINKIENS